MSRETAYDQKLKHGLGTPIYVSPSVKPIQLEEQCQTRKRIYVKYGKVDYEDVERFVAIAESTTVPDGERLNGRPANDAFEAWRDEVTKRTMTDGCLKK